ncbi:MAG: LamG domain-containing protein [Aestuariibacter sp.]|nr:LamG domain-containing protein [Aestuariibacter sp.]
MKRLIALILCMAFLNGLSASADWRRGLAGMNGSSDRADIDIPFIGTPFSIAVWCRQPAAAHGVMASIADSSVGNQQYRLGWDTTEDKFYADIFSGSFVSANRAEKAAADDPSITYLVVGVWESPTSRRCYVQGVSGVENTNSDADATGIDRFSVGCSADSTPIGFYGGDVMWSALYDRAVSSAEVAGLCNMVIANTNEGASLEVPRAWMPDLLTAVNLADLSGDTDGTCSDATVLNYGADGWVGTFAGGSDIAFGDSPWDGSMANHTLAAWVYLSDPSSSVEPILAKGSGGSAGWQWLTLSGVPRFDIDGDDILASQAITEDQWHFLSVSLTADTIYFYIDGVLDTNKAFTVGGDNSTAMKIGDNSSGAWWDGKLDNVQMYPSVLNATQHLALYNGTQPTNSAVLNVDMLPLSTNTLVLDLDMPEVYDSGETVTNGTLMLNNGSASGTATITGTPDVSSTFQTPSPHR